jgi:hypothetical protein
MYCTGAAVAEVYDDANGGPLYFIPDIYDCAIEPNRWPAVLRTTAKLVRGCASVITAYSPANNSLRIEARWNIGKKFQHAMIANAPISPAAQAIGLLGDQPFTASAFIGDDEFGNSLWFENVLRPMRCHDVAIAPLTKSGEEFSSLTIMRRASLGPYLPRDIEMLEVLSPHFRHAATIAHLLNFKSLANHCRPDARDPIPSGIILTDAVGRIVHTNRAAERMLDGLVLLCIDDELSARDSKSAASLRNAIIRAGRSGKARLPQTVASITARGPGVQGLAIWVMPLDTNLGSPAGIPSAARVAIFVREPDAIQQPTPEMFARRHGMTAEECYLLGVRQENGGEDAGHPHANCPRTLMPPR